MHMNTYMLDWSTSADVIADRSRVIPSGCSSSGTCCCCCSVTSTNSDGSLVLSSALSKFGSKGKSSVCIQSHEKNIELRKYILILLCWEIKRFAGRLSVISIVVTSSIGMGAVGASRIVMSRGWACKAWPWLSSASREKRLKTASCSDSHRVWQILTHVAIYPKR